MSIELRPGYREREARRSWTPSAKLFFTGGITTAYGAVEELRTIIEQLFERPDLKPVLEQHLIFTSVLAIGLVLISRSGVFNHEAKQLRLPLSNKEK